MASGETYPVASGRTRVVSQDFALSSTELCSMAAITAWDPAKERSTWLFASVPPETKVKSVLSQPSMSASSVRHCRIMRRGAAASA